MTDASERERLREAVRREVDAGRSFALATIVGTKGSTYRREGARLLVRADGTWEGNLSGGCLEGEVIDVGQRVIDGGEPELVSYDLTADEEAIWGWGLGCNGAIDVLVEPATAGARAVELLDEGSRFGRSHALVTVVASSHPDVPVGRHVLVGARDDDRDAGLPRPVIERVIAALDDGRTERSVVEVGDATVEVLVEVVRPALRLVVCGAGHDAIPLVAFARQLGWEPVVVDDRSSFLSEQRFPEAERFVHARPADAAEAVGPRERTAVVIMSHNFLRDVDYLGSFLGADVDYLGVLGPRRRLERLLEQLAERGIEASPEDRVGLHGPAGLDIGAEGPAEIAWAICAEVLAVDRGRDGGFLADREGPIHRREAGTEGGSG